MKIFDSHQDMEINYTPAHYVHKRFLSSELSPVEYLKLIIRKISEKSDINAYITLCDNTALKKAVESEKRYFRKEPLSSIDGILIAVKDNINVRDYECTAGSEFLKNCVSVENASVINKLEEKGAIIIGKTNCDEFAMGSSTEYSCYGSTKNPYNKDYVPGGSSGGTAAAIASGLATAGLGSDTGGSVRLPASFCNLSGFRPGWGMVSRYGLIAHASSLDQIGPICHDSLDSYNLFNAISFKDKLDMTCNPQYLDSEKSLKTMKFAVPDFIYSLMNRENNTLFEKFKTDLKELNIECVDVRIRNFNYALPSYFIISTSEASSNLARYDGIRYGNSMRIDDMEELIEANRGYYFGDEVKRRILLGTFSLSKEYKNKYYEKAQYVQKLLKKEYSEILNQYDFIITPTCLNSPFRLGELKNNILELYKTDLLTVMASLCRLPSISIPWNFNSVNMPVGIQITGPEFMDKNLLKTAHYLEKNSQAYLTRAVD